MIALIVDTLMPPQNDHLYFVNDNLYFVQAYIISFLKIKLNCGTVLSTVCEDI